MRWLLLVLALQLLPRQVLPIFIYDGLNDKPPGQECNVKQEGNPDNVFITEASCATSDQNLAPDTSTKTQKNISTNSTSGPTCKLYMAESSIPSSGLGLYTAIPLKQGQIISYPEIVLSFHDYEYNMKMIAMFTVEEMAEWEAVAGNSTDNNEGCVGWAKAGECELNTIFMKANCAKSCSLKKAGLDLDKAMSEEYDKLEDCGVLVKQGSCENHHSWMSLNCPESCLAKKFNFEKYVDFDVMPWIIGDYIWSSYKTHTGNEAHNTVPVIPGLGAAVNCHLGLINMKGRWPTVDSAGYHRANDVGVGAFSNRYNFTFQTTEDLPAGMELFADYGDSYFMGPVREKTYGKVPLGEDYVEADAILQKFWHDIKVNHKDMNESAKTKYAQILDSISKEKVKMVMPKTFEEAVASKESTTAMLSVPNVIRSRHWLSENGMCVDNIYPGKSTIPQAGRGAFASRRLVAGAIISPMPLLPMNKTLLRTFKDGREMNQLLVYNYVFGHNRSSLCFLSYAPIVNFVNNNLDKRKVNAKIQWSETKHNNQSWGKENPQFVLEQGRVGLMLELVATTNIEEHEEIFIDYGREWDQAWTSHIQTWETPPESQDFQLVEDLNKENKLKTEEEQAAEPLGYNVKTLCWLNVEWLTYHIQNGKISHRYEDFKVDREVHSGADSTTTLGCHIDRRYKSKDPRNDGKYFYRIYLNIRNEDGEGKVFVKGVPREAIEFVNKPYTSDEHMKSAFRHHIGIPHNIFPTEWMDIK